MSKFRKKPVVIEAEQFMPSKKPWPDGVRQRIITGEDGEQYEGCMVVDTLEGTLSVTPGDWIITGVKGEKYPCKDDIFKMTYEAAPDDQT